MKNKLSILIFGMFLLIGSLGIVSAEKMWNFNNHTVNISDDLYVGGIIYGDLDGGSGDSLWNESGSNIYPYNLSKNVGIGTGSPSQALDVVGKIYASENFKFDDGNKAISIGTSTGDTLLHQTILGYQAGYGSSGGYLTSLGYQAGYGNTGQGSIAIGLSAANQNTGLSSIAIGSSAANQNAGELIVAIGSEAGSQNTGDYVSFLGYNSGKENKGLRVNGVGMVSALRNEGNYLNSMGYYAGSDNKGNESIGIGSGAISYNFGNYVVGIGYEAGGINDGDYVIGLGYKAVRNNSANNVVGIGYGAGKDNILANQFIVKQANVNSNPLIQGDFGTGMVNLQNLNVTGTIYGTVEGEGLWNESGSNIFPYDLSKKIGIGIDTPLSPLHIYSTADSIFKLQNPDGGYNYMEFFNASGRTAYMGMISDTKFSVDSLLYLDLSSDRVGIGTSNPQHGNLEIKSTAGDATKGITLYDGTYTPARSWIGSNGEWHLSRSAATEGITIDSSGNVGIGDISPDAKLDVNGDVIISGGKITGSNSEYVSVGETDDLIIFQGASGTDNTNFAIDLDGIRPDIYSPTDNYVGFLDSIYMNNFNINYVNQLHFNDNLRFYDGGDDSYLIFRYGDTGAGGIKVYDGDSQLQGYLYANGAQDFGFLDADGNWAFRIDKDVSLDFFVNNNERMVLDAAGNLQIDGNVTAQGFYYASDENLKKNVFPLESSLEKIKKLEGISFDWKADGGKSMGLIAQDVEKIYPELVGSYNIFNETTNETETYKTVQYGNLVAPLIEAVKELDEKNIKQDEKIEEQKKRIEKLEKSIGELRKLVLER